MNGPVDQALRRRQLENFAALLAEKRRRNERALHKTRGHRDPESGEWVGGLLSFVRYFWHILEPSRRFVEGMPLEAMCEHLEAVSHGEIRQLLINIPPGFMKSLLVDVFWPAFEWGPMEMSHLRYVAFSYSASLTERDNGKFRDLIMHAEFQAMYGDVVQVRKTGETKITNTAHGFKLATSIGGVGTGERGDRIILDDPHNVKESESDTVRDETIRWFRESMSSRMNDIAKSAVVVIMQRVHENDVSGTILELELPYVHLCIPMRLVWDADANGEPYPTEIGWVDPRWSEDQDQCDGALAWEERFPEDEVVRLEHVLGPYASASQLQQTPEPRGGGIIKREYWQSWGKKFPPFSYLVASLDGAFTENEQNDPSALTIWGIFEHEGYNRAMLVFAWRKFLKFEGVKLRPDRGENQQEFMERQMKEWGLVEWTAHTMKHWKCDRLLIEAKASGISTAQSLEARYKTRNWAVQLENVQGDKVSRALAVQASFSQGMIYAPTERAWCQEVINECAVFPKGRYKDLTDSTTQAIKHLRDCGLLEYDEDIRAAKLADARHEGQKLNDADKIRNYMPGT